MCTINLLTCTKAKGILLPSNPSRTASLDQLCLDTTPLTEDSNIRQDTKGLIDKLAFVDPQSSI